MAEHATFDLALDGAVSGGEDATAGDNPLDWDAAAIAESAAAAAGAAVCAAYGLAAAAPLCGIVAGEVMSWAIDNVIGPLGDFFSGAFAPKPIERLIEREWSDYFESGQIVDYVEGWAVAQAGQLAELHKKFGLRGEYGLVEAMNAVHARGVYMPRRSTMWDSWGEPMRDRRVRIPQNWAGTFAYFFSQVPESQHFLTTVISHPATRGAAAWEEKIVTDLRTGIFDKWSEDKLIPWMNEFAAKVGDEARFLAEQGIAWEATMAAIRTMPVSAGYDVSRLTIETLRSAQAQAVISDGFATQLALIEKKEVKRGVPRVLVLAGIGAAVGLGVWLWRKAG